MPSAATASTPTRPSSHMLAGTPRTRRAQVQAEAQVGEGIEGEPAGVGERGDRRLLVVDEERVPVRVARPPIAPSPTVSASQAPRSGSPRRTPSAHSTAAAIIASCRAHWLTSASTARRAGADPGVDEVRGEREQQHGRGRRRGGAAGRRRPPRSGSRRAKGARTASTSSVIGADRAHVEPIWTDRGARWEHARA